MSTVLVIGLGDLGSRVLDTLARSRRIERLIGATRDEEHGRTRANQSRLLATLQSGPAHVEFSPADISDVAATAVLLRRLAPDVIVTSATRHTWWRGDTFMRGGVEGLPYGSWLPLQIPLVRDLMRARRESGIAAPVVCLPYPDGVGPALAPLGLAPELGGGNVSELAAKLAVLSHGLVRLLMHHAVSQHLAFRALPSVAPSLAEEPPWAAEVLVHGEALPPEQVKKLLHTDWPLPQGTISHDVTAAATAQVVEALLSDHLVRIHAPAPDGRPGGYPLCVASGRIELDLPAGLSEADAIALNEQAARWDGLEHVDDDGTLHLTQAAASAAERVLGVDLRRIGPADIDAVADELERARERWIRSS